MKRAGWVLSLCVLATGFDVPAQTEYRGQDIEPPSEYSHGQACIALAVFTVARDGSWLEQAMVAQSIINNSTGDTDVCTLVDSVLTAAGWKYPRNPYQVDAAAWAQATAVVSAVVSGDYYIPPPCSLVVGSLGPDRVVPKGMVPVCSIGELVFVAPLDKLPPGYAPIADAVTP